MLMTIEGSAHVRLRAAGDMNFAEGTLWSEGGAGTNAIGTAIALDHAVQVFGPEHFSDPVQRWTCSAAPIHDPDTGAVIGVIDLTGDLSTVHPHSLAVATATARAVEARLRLALQERDARLHARYGDRVAGRRTRRALVTPTGRAIGSIPPGWGVAGRLAIPPGGGSLMLPSGDVRDRRAGLPHARGLRRARGRVAPRHARSRGRCVKLALPRPRPRELEIDGRVTELRPRLAEILALLCAHPDGMSAERCAPTCTATAAASPACASRSGACASCSARGSTPTATA